MSSIVVAGDTSGSITIAAPAVAGSGTLTLPTGTDTLVGKATTDTLTNKSIAATQLTGTIAASVLPAGSVLQVVQGTYASQVTNTTVTYVDSGLTATITPSSASSKILIFAYLGQCGKTAADTQLDLRIVRAATSIFPASAINQGSATLLVGNPTLVYLDSPATTSATAYKVQLSNRNTGTVYTNVNGTSTITLMEIQG